MKSKRQPVPKIPPVPPPPKQPLTPLEGWYLQAFAVLTNHLKRPPSIPEFALYVRKSWTPCYAALKNCAAKGHLVRQGKGRARKFVFPPEPKKPESTAIPGAGVEMKK